MNIHIRHDTIKGWSNAREIREGAISFRSCVFGQRIWEGARNRWHETRLIKASVQPYGLFKSMSSRSSVETR